jgi:hypothetical protein
MYRVEERVSDKGEIVTCIFKTFEDGTEVGFTNNPSNSDYQAYLRWLENPDADEGGTL